MMNHDDNVSFLMAVIHGDLMAPMICQDIHHVFLVLGVKI